VTPSGKAVFYGKQRVEKSIPESGKLFSVQSEVILKNPAIRGVEQA
jgi:hypothetical protein